MSDRLPARHRRLLRLAALPTAPGRERRVVDWVLAWARRRTEVKARRDRAGNLLLTVARRGRRPPVVAVAHMDHPGFVVEEARGRTVTAAFRGGVLDPYFEGAGVEIIGRDGESHAGRAVGFDPGGRRAEIRLARAAVLERGDVGRWRFPWSALGVGGGRLRAHACDDLAGVAAALEALDIARRRPDLGHFAVLLTRGEEMGFLGAIAAAKGGTLRADSRVLSIEASRGFPDSPIGGGPVVRVGDASTVFDSALTDRVAAIARSSGITHQRKLMAGGSCEATAFGAYGLSATGLCLPLENYHNMVDIDGVQEGRAPAGLAPEEIGLADFDGLVRLLVEVAAAIDEPDDPPLATRLDALFESEGHILAE